MIDPKTIDPRSLPALPLYSRQMLPTASGIYFAIDGDGVVQYIGRSQNINKRWKQHHRHVQLDEVGGIIIAWLEISDLSMLKVIEKALISFFCPPLNCIWDNPSSACGSVSNIAFLREQAGLTQRELAQAVGVTETTIRNYEKGRSVLDWIERVIRLCHALKCSPEDLIIYKDTFDEITESEGE